jgi:uncharacterized protein DUF885
MATKLIMNIRETIEQFSADWESLERRYPIQESPTRTRRLHRLVQACLPVVSEFDLNDLHGDARTDAVVFRNELDKRDLNLSRLAAIQDERLLALGFAAQIFELEESRMQNVALDPKLAARAVSEIAKGAGPTEHRSILRAAEKAFDRWFEFYNAYDPAFSWWLAKPAADLKEALKKANEDMAEPPITGHPIGRDELLKDLDFEGIPYTPEELIAIGERELIWCNEEIAKASQELGFPADGKDAMEHVKDLAGEPGKQVQLIQELAEEAIAYLEARDLLTIPELAKETWRMTMMSPENQLTSPFFLGGECIWVSYPTSDMTHERKLMSMRGNGGHFSRATVQHELIPGHHMQQFMCRRHRPYREAFETPFWIEGWALYWEMRLWDLGFARGPEDRLGMLFWRRHRAARISFSLKYHMGQMSIEECVRMLVEEVGHEPSTAEGEVRRSFKGDYPPLYQAAYLIGGIQFRALWRELVGGGKMTDRDFHDAILQQNFLPVSVLREVLSGRTLTSWTLPEWKFS